MNHLALLWLRRTVLTCVFATALVPLVVIPSLAYPFVSGRTFLFWIVIEIAAGAWVVLLAYDARYRPRASFVLGALACLIVILGIADLAGIDPARSFWSSLSHMEGFVTLAHLFAFVLIAGTMLATERLWTRYFSLVAGVGTLVAVYALLQTVGLFPIHTDAGRIDATFGNALYYAGYLTAYFFLLLFLAVRLRTRRMPLALLGVLASAILVLLFLTKTRSGIIGVVVGMFIGFWYLVVTKSLKVRTLGIVLLFLGGGIGISLLFTSRLPAVQGPLWSRFAPLLQGDLKSAGEGRYYLWEAAIQEFEHHPFLGIGQENFQYAANTYYNPALYYNETWVDRAHNVLLEWLVAGGVLGALAYLLIYAASFATILRKHEFPGGKYAQAALIAFLVGYGTYLLFAFDTLATYVLFASVLAYLHAVSPPLYLKVPFGKFFAKARPVLVAFCVAASVAILVVFDFPALNASIAFKSAAARASSDPYGALTAFKRIFAGNTLVVPDAYVDFSSLATSVAGQQRSPDDPLARAYLSAAIAEGQRLEAAHPAYAFYHYSLGQLFAAAGMFDNAYTELAQAHASSPRRQLFLFSIGFIQLTQSAYPQAAKTFREAYELDTTYPEARLLYAVALIYDGRSGEAKALSPDLDLDYEGNDVLLAAYVQTHDFSDALDLLSYRQKLYPADQQIQTLVRYVHQLQSQE